MAFYADVSAASADGVLHHFDFDDASLTFADKIDSWSGSVLIEDLPDRPASSVAGSDVMIQSILGRAMDNGNNIPASPANPSYEYLTMGELPALVGEGDRTTFSIRFRIYHKNEYDGYFLVIPTGGSFPLYFYISSDRIGCNWLSSTSYILTRDAWNEMVFTYSGGVAKFYLNGTYNNQRTITRQINLSLGSTFVGGYDGTTANLSLRSDTILDELTLWSRELTSTEVGNLWNGGTAQRLIALPPQIEIYATLLITGDFEVLTDFVAANFDVTFPVSASVALYQDWIESISPWQLQEVYKLVVTGAANGVPDLVIGGISSWQATNQAGDRSSYLQAVIPAAGQYLDDLTTRQDGELVIFKGYRLSDGSEQYSEILRSNFDTLRYDRGPGRLTATVSGYLSGRPVSSGARTVTGVRSINLTGGKYRVRCDIDLFLQPGMTVTADDVTFVADYINYYVSETDKFCEVGEQ